MTSPRSAKAPERPIQCVRRALRLIEQLASEKVSVPISQLSRKVGLHVSTTHRLLSTLRLEGFVQQDAASGRYLLGPRLLLLGQQYLSGMDLRQAVHPYLEELNQRVDETVNLVLLSQSHALYVDSIEGRRSLTIFSRIGLRAPLHCTASGKVLLAAMPEGQSGEWAAAHPLDAHTSQTIREAGGLQRELQRVRRQGFALDLEECEEGMCCAAAPLRNSRGETVAAVSISVPSVRMRGRRQQEIVQWVVQTAGRISERLGWNPDGGRPASAAQRSA